MNFLKTRCLLKIIGSGDGSAGKQMQQQCEDWTSLWNPHAARLQSQCFGARDGEPQTSWLATLAVSVSSGIK